MALYSTSNIAAAAPAQTSLASTYTAGAHQLGISAATATLRRAFIYEFSFGTSAAPASTDTEVVWDLSRSTDLGTGGVTMTANPPDPADAATGTQVRGNWATTAPAITAGTASMWCLGTNQRASYRWVVNPGGPGEIVVPATNLAGLTMRGKSTSYTGTAIVGILFRE